MMKKISRRSFLQVCGITAATAALTACGGGKTETPSDSNTPADNTSAEPTKLSLILRGGTYADVIKECLPAFEAEHNVVCEVQELSEGDLYSGIALDAINDKGSYDLCMVDGSWMAEFTENGVLANLTELGYSLDDDVIPATTAICYVGDDLYLAPYYGNVTVLLYNKANVEAAGYSGDTILSLEDMLAICEKAKAVNSRIETVVTKEGVAAAVISRHPKAVERELEEAAKRALSGDLNRYRYALPEHFRVTVAYQKHYDAAYASHYFNTRRLDAHTVEFCSDDYEEVLRFFHFVL